MFESEGAGAHGKSHWLKAEPLLQGKLVVPLHSQTKSVHTCLPCALASTGFGLVEICRCRRKLNINQI